MRFLTGTDIQAQVRNIASRPGPLMVAVAYWGKGATELTGLAERDDPAGVRVICDLLSGACNPAEVETLARRGVNVRTLDRLHAKVWISGDEVIVGSANASHSGLPWDEEEAARASIEAAVLTRSVRLARQLSIWFEEQWCASTEIKKSHLDQARDIWSRRHRSGGRSFTTPPGDRIGDPDRAALRERLLAQVVEAARELCRSNQFSPDLTLQAIRACEEDSEWRDGYARFVGGNVYGTRNPLKRLINPDFGSRVKASVGARNQENEDGKPVMGFVQDQIIQSYTRFADYDPRAVEVP